MKFCGNCDNMFYIRIDEENPNNLNYYCRHCGNSESSLEGNLCIIDTNMKETETSFDYIINEFTKRGAPRYCFNTHCSSTTKNI